MLFYPLIDLLTPALPSDLNQELASLGSLLYPSEMVRFQYCRTATIPVLQHSSIVLLALDSYLCNSIYRQLFLYGSLWPNWDLTFVCMIIWFLSVLVHSATITKYHILFFFFFFFNKQQTCITNSCEAWKSKVRLPGQSGCKTDEKRSSLVELISLCSHMMERTRELSGFFFIWALTLSGKALP